MFPHLPRYAVLSWGLLASLGLAEAAQAAPPARLVAPMGGDRRSWSPPHLRPHFPKVPIGRDPRSWSPYPLRPDYPIRPIGSDRRSWSPYPVRPDYPIGWDRRSWSPYPLRPVNPIRPIGWDRRSWSPHPLRPVYPIPDYWIPYLLNPYDNPYGQEMQEAVGFGSGNKE